MSFDHSERCRLPPKKRFKTPDGPYQAVSRPVESCENIEANPGVSFQEIRAGVIRHTSCPGHCIGVLVTRIKYNHWASRSLNVLGGDGGIQVTTNKVNILIFIASEWKLVTAERNDCMLRFFCAGFASWSVLPYMWWR